MAWTVSLSFGRKNVRDVQSAFGIEPEGDTNEQENQLRRFFQDKFEFGDGYWTAKLTAEKGDFSEEIHRLASTRAIFLGYRKEEGANKGVYDFYCHEGELQENFQPSERGVQETGLEAMLHTLHDMADDAGMYVQALRVGYGESKTLDSQKLSELSRTLATCMLLTTSLQPPKVGSLPGEIVDLSMPVNLTDALDEAAKVWDKSKQESTDDADSWLAMSQVMKVYSQCRRRLQIVQR